MKKSKYFKIYELVPPETVKLLGEEKAWSVLDDRLIDLIDGLKEFFNYTMIINTYGLSTRAYDEAVGKPYKYSGFRPDNCGVGIVGGLHYGNPPKRGGIAGDIRFYDKSMVSAKTMRQDIVKNKDKFPTLHGLELGVSWVHADCGVSTDTPKRSGIGKGQIFCVDINDNNKSFIASKPEDWVKVY